jgi:hypothetical protein
MAFETTSSAVGIKTHIGATYRVRTDVNDFAGHYLASRSK